MGGSNKKENLVELTAREHFICHWLLVRIYPKSYKLRVAFWGMSNQKNNEQTERYTPTSRTYEEARQGFSEMQSTNKIAFYKTKKGAEIKAKMSADRAKLYQTVKGRDIKAKQVANTDYCRRTANTDYVASGKKRRKPILQFTKEGVLIKEWESGVQASIALKISRGNISSCLKGTTKTAGKFIWKYK